MIQQQTLLNVSDNSGAKTAKCIKVLGGFKKKFSKIGDMIVISIQKLRNKTKINLKVKKGEIYKAIIIKTKKPLKIKDGTYLRFSYNSVCLLNKQHKLLSTRILGPIPKKFRKNKFIKLASLSSGFI